MAAIRISVINASTVLSDTQIQPVVEALETQVKRDFLPAWGIDADLLFVPMGTNPPANTWWLAILDDSDQANALGYHDVTTDGQPIGKVFAATDMKYGMEWSVTASHELLEMLADPNINLTVFVENDMGTGRLFAYEVCDACEADNLGYKIDGTLVSDFVYPSWFEDFRTPGTQFDHTGKIKTAFDILPGGYIGIYDINSGTGWQQLQAEHAPVRMQARGNVGSRRERRRTPRPQWQRSMPLQQLHENARRYREVVRHLIAA
jgi:hypothetical protein